MDEFVRDVRSAFRGMRKNPSATVVIVLIVAVGIGVTTAMFSLVNAVLLKPLSFNESDRVVVIWKRNPARGLESFAVSAGDFSEWRRQNSVFESIAAYQRRSLTLTGLKEAQRVEAVYVSEGFFDVMQTPARLGRTVSIEEAERQAAVVVISHEFWKSRFNEDVSVLERSVVLDGNSYSIVGVMPEDFMYPANTAAWAPFQHPQIFESPGHGKHDLTVIARLSPGITLSAAGAQMKTIAARLQQDYGETNDSWTAVVSDVREETVKDLRTPVLLLFGAVAFVLLIACANIAGLLLARGARRQREIAVRSALGASPMRVLRQLMTETVVLSFLGGIIGIGMAYGLLLTLLRLVPANLPRIHESKISWAVLIFGFVLAIATGVVFGIAPGLQLLRGNAMDRLKASTQTAFEGPSGRRLRSLLVVTEIALTIVVTSGAGLMAKSLYRLRAVDSGFNPEQVLTLQLDLPERTYADPEHSVSLVTQLLDRFHRLPGVLHVASTNALPLSAPALGEASPVVGFFVEGPEPERRSAQARFITPDYFQTLQIPMLRGREFTRFDRQNSPRVVIVNETLARQAFHDQFPIGKRMKIGGESHEIVGIVRDIRDEDLRLTPDAMYFLPVLQPLSNVSSLIAKVRFVVRVAQGQDLQALVAQFRSEIKSADAGLAVSEVHTMDDIRRLSVSRTSFAAGSFTAFALLGLLLAAVGVYGVVAAFVSERTREFGIRIALGAEPRDVLRIVMRQTLALCGLGGALGLFGSLATSRLIRGMVFEVSPNDPGTLTGAVLFLVLVATATSLVPALRATRIDPIASLRHE